MNENDTSGLIQESNPFEAQEIFGGEYEEPQQQQQDLQYFEAGPSNFSSPDPSQGKINSDFQGMEDAGFTEPEVNNQNNNNAQKESDKNAHFWSVRYYRHLFDVETKQVVTRIMHSVVPHKNFFDVVQPNADLYGPFWVVTTLIFMMAATGNFGSFIAYLGSNVDKTVVKWQYDFNIVSIAAATVYSYTFGIPILLWLLFKYTKVAIGLLDVMCLYGYSMFIYIPISVICVTHNELLQWIAIFSACGISAAFLAFNLFLLLKQANKPLMIVIPVILALHVALAFVFKLYFFDYSDYNNLDLSNATVT